MEPTKFMYDWEFHEDGSTIDPISLGMVNYDTGDTLYVVSNEFDTRRVAKNWWLMDNVMCSIRHDKFVVADHEGAPVVRDIYVTDPAAMSRIEMRDSVLEFTKGTKPEFWAWYSAYDHVCLAQLFGKMIELPEHFPMLTLDIKQEHKRAGYPEMPKQPEGKHNALADAQFNVVRYNYLKERLDG